MPLIKSGNWRAGEECQRMKLLEGFRDIVVLSIDLADSVHQLHPNTGVPLPDSRRIAGLRLVLRLAIPRQDHLPSVTLMPSQTAPTNPVAMMVITALKV